MEVLKPYEDSKNIRTFKGNVGTKKLVWHRDKEFRFITVLEGENWKLQFDDEDPKVLLVGAQYLIPRMVYHRLWRGDGDLKIYIERVKIWESKKTKPAV
jgi:hypothetical protein